MLVTLLILLLTFLVRERSIRLALAASRARTDLAESLLTASPTSVVVVDHEERLVRVNSAAAQLFGYEPQDLLGKKVSLLISPTTTPAERHGLQLALHAPAPNSDICQVVGRCHDDNTFH